MRQGHDISHRHHGLLKSTKTKVSWVDEHQTYFVFQMRERRLRTIGEVND